jgi:hypothetical protein
MVRMDLDAARAKWIEEAKTDDQRKRRESSSFLKYIDDNGHYADFHALRSTFITNLSRADVSPKVAQTLARHSTINLTMNTYTTLSVMDQAAAVESLPPLPEKKSEPATETLKATGTEGGTAGESGPRKVPTRVPRGADIGAVRLAPETYRLASLCTEVDDPTGDVVAVFGQKPRKNRVGPEGFEAPTKEL